jgi:hypothetical protein
MRSYVLEVITFWTILHVPRTFKHDSTSVKIRGGTCNRTLRTARPFPHLG